MFSKYFPRSINLEVEDCVLSNFLILIERIKLFTLDPKNNPPNSIAQLKSDLSDWLGLYLTLKDGKITPYVHAFVFHVPEFIEKYDDVNIFNMQGLEKLNDFSTIYYHRSTNKQRKNKKYLIQLLQKRNRIEFFTLNGHNNISL